MKLIPFIFFLFSLNISIAQKSIGLFLVEGNDCPNCLVGVINLKKKLELKKIPFIYVLNGLSENEVNDFFTYSLQDSTRSKNKSVIVNNRLFNYYSNGQSGSRFIGLSHQNISFNFPVKEINDSLVSAIYNLLKEKDTSSSFNIDYSGFNTKKNEVCKSNNIFNNAIKNRNIFFHNDKSGIFFKYNLESKNLDSLFNLNHLLNNSKINNLLSIISCQTNSELQFACNFKYLNSRVFGYSNLSFVNRDEIYLGVDIYYAFSKNAGRITVDRFPFLLKLDKSYSIEKVFSPSVCVSNTRRNFYVGLTDNFFIRNNKLYTFEYHNSDSYVNVIQTELKDKIFDSMSSKVFSFKKEEYLPKFVKGENRGYLYRLISCKDEIYYFNLEVPIFVNIITNKRNNLKGIEFNYFKNKDSMSNFYILSANRMENSVIEIVYFYDKKLYYSQITSEFELIKTKTLFEKNIESYKFIAFEKNKLYFINIEDDTIFNILKN